jgi:hypothetical protein
LSAAPKGAKGKRRKPGARGPKIGQTEIQKAKADRAARWDANRDPHRGVYNERLEGKQRYINNRQFARDLELLANLRKDPYARLFLQSLISDGFLNGKPAAVAKRMAFDLDEIAPFVAGLVAMEINESASRGKPMKIREAAEEVCARHGLPGNGLTAAVAMVEKRYRDYRDNGPSFLNWQPGETGGAWLVWPIHPGDFDLPAQGMVVPDDTHWREKVFAGLVNNRYLPAETVENHSRNPTELPD